MPTSDCRFSSFPSVLSESQDTMRLPTYRSSHGRRHHPYPQSKRAFARRTFAVRPSVYTATASGDSSFSIQHITVNDHQDEVSARAQVPLVRAVHPRFKMHAAHRPYIYNASWKSNGLV